MLHIYIYVYITYICIYIYNVHILIHICVCVCVCAYVCVHYMWIFHNVNLHAQILAQGLPNNDYQEHLMLIVANQRAK